METQNIWDNFNEELYFFILKRVKDKDITNDIFQNTFFKIHKNLSSLEKEEKARAWVFQIARNEISNHFNKESIYVDELHSPKEALLEKYEHICCFDQFIDDLPEIYNQVIELIYIKGLKQKEVAEALDISLENVKARVSRAKEILKKKFNECCQYELDEQGRLRGEANCSQCSPSVK
ncbi:sigma-70 family RNA polymerase sigma factor [Weeksellaceae bacterium KMM 9724]|uniref:sigma-70 family RNA polymerase sigma factor n=1 Tax=Profundicola chukchiensis TaxID=2961959 RepID=UPI00244067EE|nr:sigma-70 family RNA polymerase sigma factor [Profundicola chukchiensis]MDG4950750.1 sigma-70 family RNA polymerase sigma factor [Profundicola chukchiensis]